MASSTAVSSTPPSHVWGGPYQESPVSQSEPLAFNQLYHPARKEEQHSHCMALSKALEERKKAFGLASLADSASSLTPQIIAAGRQQRLYHLFCRLGALDFHLPQESLFEKAQEASLLHLSIEERAKDLGISLTPASTDLIRSFREKELKIDTLLQDSSFESEKTSFLKTLSSLETLLKEPSQSLQEDDFESKNHSILITLRSLFSSIFYEALCTSQLPLIDVLHSLAIGQYTNTTLAPTFEKIGKKLQQPESPLPQRVDSIWNRLKKSCIDNGFFSTLFHYSLREVFQIGLPLIALKICQFLSLNWLIPYIGDERSILGNTPGALTDEIQKNKGLGCRKIRTVVMAAPTFGYKIAPEFQAALQALENNQLNRTDNPFLTWAYTNLQNISFTPEHPSTIALMALHNQYPLSFQAITLPQNLRNSESQTFSREDVQFHLSLLFQERTSFLEKRGIHGDSGYYFPKEFLENHRLKIETIAEEAYRIIEKNQGQKTPKQCKAAFIKLFHLGLTRLHESESFRLAAARTQRSAFSAIRSTICASCIDRGGMMTAAITHALDSNNSLSDLTIGAYFGRAILCHRRSPTHISAKRLSNLYTVVSAADVKEFLLHITPEASSTLVPAA
jgi:hypothetical protein